MSNEVGQTVALWEALTEARTLIEDVTRLGEELKARQERLAELLVPSETALKARTEYLEKLMHQYLSRAEKRMIDAAEEMRLSCKEESPYSRALTEASWRLTAPKPPKPSRRPLVLQLLAMTLGGFLAGTVATWATNAPATKPPEVSAAPSSAPPAKAAKSRPIAPAR